MSAALFHPDPLGLPPGEELGRVYASHFGWLKLTYLQLSLLHIPAIVLHGNSLSNQVWGRWYTPAHVLGGWRRRIEERRARAPEPLRIDAGPPAVPAPPDAVPVNRSEPAARRRPQAGQDAVGQLDLFGD